MQLLRVAPDDPRLPESVAKASLNASGLHKCVFYEVHQPGILKTCLLYTSPSPRD